MSQTPRSTVGILGEELAVRYLSGKGFNIICRNYRKAWSEIDLIAESKKGLHFVEVKSVRTRIGMLAYRPEDNAHSQKLRRVARGAQTYLLEKKLGPDTPWQIDVIAVEIDYDRKVAKIRYIESVSVS